MEHQKANKRTGTLQAGWWRKAIESIHPLVQHRPCAITPPLLRLNTTTLLAFALVSQQKDWTTDEFSSELPLSSNSLSRRWRTPLARCVCAVRLVLLVGVVQDRTEESSSIPRKRAYLTATLRGCCSSCTLLPCRLVELNISGVFQPHGIRFTSTAMGIHKRYHITVSKASNLQPL